MVAMARILVRVIRSLLLGENVKRRREEKRLREREREWTSVLTRILAIAIATIPAS